MDLLEGARIIPIWENASWKENEGSAPSKPSYFRRSFNYIFNKKQVQVQRVNTMVMSSIDSNPNPIDKITPLRRTMSLDYINVTMTAYRSNFSDKF